MAEGTLIEPGYITKLSSELSSVLHNASISHEHVRDSRYRFLVVSPTFEGMGHPQRQQIVWDAAEKALDKAELREVAMIITMAVSELGD